MKRVLFLGTTDFDFNGHNKTLEKKYLGLSQKMRIFVLARGKKGEYEKYNAKFFLIPKKFGKPGLFLWLIEAFLKAKQIIQKEKIDIIIAQSPAMDGLISVLLKKIYKIELVVEAHGDWIESPFFYFNLPFKSILKKLLIFSGKISLKNADKVRAVSGFTEELIKKYAPKNKPIYVFNTFSDVEIFKNEKEIGYEKYIYYAGWLYKLKGVHVLIDAFLKIQKKFPDYKLIITGDGPYREILEKMAENNDKIEFTGWKKQEEVKDMMKKCRVYVLPSFSEGFPRVLIESAMLQKAMIGSRAGGIPDMIKDNENGFLFEPGNVEELSQKLEMIISNKGLAISLGKKARAMAEDKFSCERYVKAYQQMIYENNNQ